MYVYAALAGKIITSREDRKIVLIPHVKVKNMHGFTTNELAKLAAKEKNRYTRRVQLAVVMTRIGILAKIISRSFGFSHASHTLVLRRCTCGTNTVRRVAVIVGSGV